MKKIFPLLLSAALLISATSAQAYPSNLVELVLEKKVMGSLEPGNRPVIQPSQMKIEGFELSGFSAPGRYPARTYKSGAHGQPLLKNYQILNSSEAFNSVISVSDARTGQEIHRISVGRRAQRLLASPATNRLYVICGGYFSSIWEIDTTHDVVVRKLGGMGFERNLSPLWNPSDMALLPVGNTLAVASGELRLIDLGSGQVKSVFALPHEAVEVLRLYPLSKHSLALISRHKNGGRAYHVFNTQTHSFKAVGSLAAPAVNPLKTTLYTPKAHYQLPSVARSAFVASRNSDFIHMVDLESLKPVAILPVDFAVDDLLLSSDRRRLFAYHRRFGQISVIELNPNSPHQFSVIRRIRDDRFRSTTEHPLYLAQAFDQVYLWDQYSEIKASIDRSSLYVKVGLPFAVKLTPPGEEVWNSDPAHKRFYLKEGELVMEYGPNGPSSLPQKIKTGSPLSAMVMSPDRRRLYLLQPDTQELLVMDAFSHKILAKLSAGKNPRALRMNYQGNRLYILNADEGSIQVMDAKAMKPLQTLALDIGLNQPKVMWLYDEKMTQLVQIELPRHLTDVARMAG